MSGKRKANIVEVQQQRDQAEDPRSPPFKLVRTVDETHPWREYAEAGQWWRICEDFVSREDREELLTLLAAKVPTRECGDGLKTFENFIHPSEAATAQEADAARLAHKLKQWEISEAKTSVPTDLRPFTDPFIEPVQAAQETFQRYGFKYEGLASTFVYWHPAANRWKQIRGERAKLVNERSEGLNPYDPDQFEWDQDRRKVLYQEWLHWRNRFPWRCCSTLQDLMKRNCLTPFTDIWYACEILRAYERTIFSKYTQPFSPPKPYGPLFSSAGQYSYAHLCDAYQAAQHIGAAFEAMKNKPYERDAIRGIKVAEGGRSRQGKFAGHTQDVLGSVK